MSLQDIKTVEELLAAADEYLRSPRSPPLKGSELNIIITKAIHIILDQITMASKSIIPATSDFTISWQTDLVPDGTKTWSQKHGNNSFTCQGMAIEGNTETLYFPSVVVKRNAGLITNVEVTGVFTGKITII